MRFWRYEATGRECVRKVRLTLQSQREKWRMEARTSYRVLYAEGINYRFHQGRNMWPVCFAAVSNKSQVERF